MHDTYELKDGSRSLFSATNSLRRRSHLHSAPRIYSTDVFSIWFRVIAAQVPLVTGELPCNCLLSIQIKMCPFYSCNW